MLPQEDWRKIFCMIKIGIIAEDNSDIAALFVLIERISKYPFKREKYAAKGCGKLKLKCSKIANMWTSKKNVTHIIICHDLDGSDPSQYKKLMKHLRMKVSNVSGHKNSICIVIPIQELEAWFLSDINGLAKIFSGLSIQNIPSPEAIQGPKEYIAKMSRDKKSKPRYIHTRHNAELAKSVNINKIFEKCPAFRPFYEFVLKIREKG